MDSRFQQIRSIARNVRMWIEEQDDLLIEPTGDLRGWCAIASAVLWRELKENDILADIHLWYTKHYFHVFLSIDDYIIDITATQFGHHESVVIKHHREAEVKEYWTVKETFKNVNDLRRFQKKNGHRIDQIAWANGM